jgi:hypothetical protein
MNRKERHVSAKQADRWQQRLIITNDVRAHLIPQELDCIANAFAPGDLRATAICQYWHDGECASAWHVEPNEQRVAIIAKLKEMIAHLE